MGLSENRLIHHIHSSILSFLMKCLETNPNFPYQIIFNDYKMTISSFFLYTRPYLPGCFTVQVSELMVPKVAGDLMANIHRGLDKYTQICNHDDSDNDN